MASLLGVVHSYVLGLSGIERMFSVVLFVQLSVIVAALVLAVKMFRMASAIHSAILSSVENGNVVKGFRTYRAVEHIPLAQAGKINPHLKIK